MEEEKNGFKVIDRRSEKDDKTVPEGKEPGSTNKFSDQDVIKDENIQELNFTTFILSLSTSVLVNLGELPDPIQNDKNVNLPLAKQTISLIEMISEKTKGNLTEEEERLLELLLYDLRMKYVETASGKKT